MLCNSVPERLRPLREARHDGNTVDTLERHSGLAGPSGISGDLRDAPVFTGGIAEHSPEVRARVVARLGLLGAHVDNKSYRTAAGDAVLSESNATVAVLVTTAQQEAAVAHAVAELVSNIRPGSKIDREGDDAHEIHSDKSSLS